MADYTIDSCQQIQNLRLAIYDFTIRLAGISNTKSKKYKEILERGINYLMRYFYLVTFANYLLEAYAIGYTSLTFTSWLNEHLEIIHLANVEKKITE